MHECASIGARLAGSRDPRTMQPLATTGYWQRTVAAPSRKRRGHINQIASSQGGIEKKTAHQALNHRRVHGTAADSY